MENVTRKIKLKLLTQVKLEVIETNVRTFGELVDLIKKDSDLNSAVFGGGDDIVMIDRDTKVEYGNIPAAVLPATDCIMFIQPVKTKSGADFQYSSSEISKLPYNDLRSYGSKLNRENNANIDLSGNTSELKTKIYGYLVKQEDVEESLEERIVDAKFCAIKQNLEDGKNKLCTAIELVRDLEETIASMTNSYPEDIVELITEESLDEEQQELLASYK